MDRSRIDNKETGKAKARYVRPNVVTMTRAEIVDVVGTSQAHATSSEPGLGLAEAGRRRGRSRRRR